MRVILLSATLVLLLVAATEAAYEDGVVAFNRGDYGVAQKELLPEAATGDRRAQFLLGAIYLYGRGSRGPEIKLSWGPSTPAVISGKIMISRCQSGGLGILESAPSRRWERQGKHDHGRSEACA